MARGGSTGRDGRRYSKGNPGSGLKKNRGTKAIAKGAAKGMSAARKAAITQMEF